MGIIRKPLFIGYVDQQVAVVTENTIHFTHRYVGCYRVLIDLATVDAIKFSVTEWQCMHIAESDPYSWMVTPREPEFSGITGEPDHVFAQILLDVVHAPSIPASEVKYV
jgi:hypothetical protein